MVSSWQRRPFLLTFVLVLIDTACITSAYYVSALVARPTQTPFLEHVHLHRVYFIVFTLVWYGAAINQRLFMSRRSDDLLPQLFAVSRALVFALMISVFLVVVFTRERIDRDFLVLFGMATLGLLLLCRSMMRLSLYGLRLRGWNTQRVIIVGANDTAVHLVRTMLAHEEFGYHIEGFLDDDPQKVEILDRYAIPYLGGIEHLAQILVDRVIDGVYIALPLRSHYELIQRVAHLCEGGGVPVRLVAESLPLPIAAGGLWRLGDVPLLSLSAAPGIPRRFLVRRAVDWIASTLLLGVLSPLIIILALLIKLDSAGPVFAFQARVRRDGRLFWMVRFRCYESGDGKTEAAFIGPRLTRLGTHLRRYNLDALPNLLNVWLGQMSFSGPRPRMAERNRAAGSDSSQDPGAAPA